MARLRRKRRDRFGPLAVLWTGGLIVLLAGATLWFAWPWAEPGRVPLLATTMPAGETPGGAIEDSTLAVASTPEPLDRGLLDRAAELVAADRLVEARAVLNDRLLAGGLTRADEDQLKSRLAEIAEVLTFGVRPFEDDNLQMTFEVPPGGRLARLARGYRVPWQAIARINQVNPRSIRAGQRLKTPLGPFHGVVDKDRFTFDLYLGAPGGAGSTYLKTFRVGLGEDSSTPTGTWRVRPGGKLENPTWTNPRTGEVVAGDDPENPLGERWIALDGIEGDATGRPSYGIHGTIEPDTIGTNASMGCIRLLDEDVEKLYDLLEPGASLVRVVE
jgi:hypothetical protein